MEESNHAYLGQCDSAAVINVHLAVHTEKPGSL